MGKRGLVLEGGAMRGLFSAGVMDVLMEKGVTFDGMIGVSAGAAFGCNYKSGQMGRALRYNVAYCRDRRYCSVWSFITTGNLFGADFCYHELPEKLDIFDSAAFEANPMAFYLVCTDVETGRAVYKRCDKSDYNFLEWMRGSASMPFLSRIVEVEGYKLLDGGIADSVPLKFFEQEGYDRNLVVLTQPEGYVKKKSPLMPLIKLALRRYPMAVEAMIRRHEVYNDTAEYIRKREQEGAAYVIRPTAPLPVGRVEHDPDRLKAAYELGRQACESHFERLTDFLKGGSHSDHT